MISLKKLLESKEEAAEAEQGARSSAGQKLAESAPSTASEPLGIRPSAAEAPSGKSLLPVALGAYRSALLDFGNCSLDACPALGDGMKKDLRRIGERLNASAGQEEIAAAEQGVRQQLREWGKRTAVHYREKASEVKEILIVLANTAESVGERDQRCAQQISDVTTRLRKVADLDDISQIRQAIESSAADLKTSIERMTTEGKAAIAQLKAEVSTYQAKLEEAEMIASSDSLTGLRNRFYLESQLEKRMETMLPFCVAIVDINGFKQINDEHGHLAGDEVLKMFSAELKSVCRSTDLIGRWGGDEFIILLDSGLSDAAAQIERLRKRVVKSYAVQGRNGTLNLPMGASIGLAERAPREPLKDLIERADAAMYTEKATTKTGAGARNR
jgi:diguanylate cyclase (GGDEF)-like protein